MLRKLAAVAALAIIAGAHAGPAAAQDYPSQPVRFIIPFAVGGGSDLHGRITADLLSQKLGTPVVVENKPGAGGAIGTDFVSKSKPDGYTVLYASSDAISIGPALKPALPYKVPQDFAFIGRTIDFPFIVIMNPALPFKTFPELIAYAKANPKKIRYGSSGVGGAPHLAFELIAKTAGVEFTHIPYTGAGQSITALMGGFIDLIMGGPAVKEYTSNGRATAIVQTGAERHDSFPDLPTLKQSGVNVDVSIWFGLAAAPGTPEPIIAKLRKAVADFTQEPTAIERITKIGYKWQYLPADKFSDLAAKEIEAWRDVAQSANIKVD